MVEGYKQEEVLCLLEWRNQQECPVGLLEVQYWQVPAQVAVVHQPMHLC